MRNNSFRVYPKPSSRNLPHDTHRSQNPCDGKVAALMMRAMSSKLSEKLNAMTTKAVIKRPDFGRYEPVSMVMQQVWV